MSQTRRALVLVVTQLVLQYPAMPCAMAEPVDLSQNREQRSSMQTAGRGLKPDMFAPRSRAGFDIKKTDLTGLKLRPEPSGRIFPEQVYG
nr:hypothetical protein [Amylibacter sp.]